MTPVDTLTLLRRLAGRKTRVGGFDALNALLAEQPHLSPHDGRRDFVAALRQLEADGSIRLPVQRTGWDHFHQSPLPLWVQLILPRESAPRWDHRSHPWHPAMAFVVSWPRISTPADLLKINAWLQRAPADEPLVPVKERSHEIFGAEKRLEEMMSTALFGPGRLSLELLRCNVVPHIPVHRVYPAGEPVMLISENEAGFDSCCRAAEQFRWFRCVVLGNGLAIDKATSFLGQAIHDYGLQRILYVGDVDAAGLAIAQRTAQLCRKRFDVSVEPWLPAYAFMLASDESAAPSALPLWLPEPYHTRAAGLIAAGRRVAQESFGWKQIHAEASRSRFG